MPGDAGSLITAGVAYVAFGWTGVGLFAASYLLNQMAADQAKRKMKNAFQDSGFLVNSQSSDAVLPVVYGRHRVGGNRVYVSTSGEHNKFLHMIITLSEGPIESVEEVYLNDKPISDFGSLAYYEFFNGNGSQSVCATLQAADPDWSDYLRWTAYLYIRLEYDADKFTGVPDVTALIEGRILYDPRTGLSVYSTNPALVWYDWMTTKRYSLGVGSSFIDTQSVVDAANWCDANGYTFNGVMAERQAFLDNLSEIMINYRGDVVWSDGKYKQLIRKYDTPVMHLTEDDIVADSFRVVLPGLADTPNRVKYSYPDEADKWIVKEQTKDDETAILDYDLEERDTEIKLLGSTSATQAMKLATYNLERARLNKAYSLLAHPRAFSLEAGDIIQVTHYLPGWTGRMVRIIYAGYPQDGTVPLTVQEESELLYDDTVNLSPHTYFETNLPDPLAVPPGVSLVSFVEEEYFNKDVSYTRLKVSFTKPTSPFWDYAEVWVNADNAGYQHYTDARGGFTIEPVKEGVSYKVKFLSVSLQQKRQAIADVQEWSYSVVGKNTPPDDVTGFKAIPQSDTIILMWDAVNAVDLQGYEIRKGTNWGSGIFIGFTRAVTFQINGVAPGTHTYMLKAVDTNGKPSTNFQLATCTVYGPASYTEKMSQYGDFNETGEVHSNTERYVDPTYGPLLRVIHGGGLSGTYTSPVYDRGSVVTRRSWPQFDVVFLGTGAAWADQFAPGALWTSRFSPSDTWLTLFGPYITGKLKMRLGYSNDGSNFSWIDYFESYVSEVQARYVKYDVTIEDVASDGYLCVKPVTYKEAYWQ